MFNKENKDPKYMLEKDRALGMTVDRLQSEIKCEAINFAYALKEINYIKGRIDSLGLRYPVIREEYDCKQAIKNVAEIESKVKEAHAKSESFIKQRMDNMITEVLEEGEADDAAR